MGVGTNSTYSQTSYFGVSDSLLIQDFTTLTDKFWNSLDNDGEFTELYARAYLIKAKKEKDSIEIARGFEYLAQISEPEQNLAFADSIIHYSLYSDHPNYPGVGYELKGYWNYEVGNYDKALDSYLLANKSAKEKNNIGQQIEVNQFIGALKSAWGDHKEALRLYEEHLRFIKIQPNYQLKYRNDYLITLHNLSLALIRDHNYPAANNSIKEAYSIINEKEDPIYIDFLFASGITLFFQGSTVAAMDSINKVLPELQDDTDLAIAYYYKGMLTADNNQRINYFSKVDSLYGRSGIEFPELRKVYETLIDYYRSKDNEGVELKYLKKLIVVDSLLAHNREYLNSIITKKYDTPALIAQKNKVIQSLSRKNRKSENLILYISVGSIIILVFAFLIYYRNILLKRRFCILQTRLQVNKDALLTSPRPIVNDGSSEILLAKLEKFEENNGFISGDITLFSLAKILKSNQTYLSKTINDHKGKNFSSYINDLRIEHTINRLNNDRKFRHYRIKDIADESGFNTAESFSRAFHKLTGMKSSYYIQKLK